MCYQIENKCETSLHGLFTVDLSGKSASVSKPVKIVVSLSEKVRSLCFFIMNLARRVGGIDISGRERSLTSKQSQQQPSANLQTFIPYKPAIIKSSAS